METIPFIHFESLQSLAEKVLAEYPNYQTLLHQMHSEVINVHPRPNIIIYYFEKSPLLSSSLSDLKESLNHLTISGDDDLEYMKEILSSQFKDSVPSIVQSCNVLCGIPGFPALEDVEHKKQKLDSKLNILQWLSKGVNIILYPVMSLALYQMTIFLIAFRAPDALTETLGLIASAVQPLSDCLNLLLDWIKKHSNEEVKVVTFVLLKICSKVQKVAQIKMIMDSLTNDQATADGDGTITVGRPINTIQDLMACKDDTLAAIEAIMQQKTCSAAVSLVLLFERDASSISSENWYLLPSLKLP